MPDIERLHLEDALEDSPQTRNLLGVFEKDALILKKYSTGLHNCCQRIMSAQNELCAATQALAQHLRMYEMQKFPLESDGSILVDTLKQFASYLDDVSSIQQVLSAQFSETMMYPLTKFLQADIEEISTMYEMFQIATHEREQALARYMKLSKKKESDKSRGEANEELYIARKKFHQTALHYFSSLNALQYKRRCFLLEPVIGYLQAQRSFFQMGPDAVCKPEIEEFTNNINSSIQSVHTELQTETKKTVELIDSLEKQSAHLYHAEPPIDMPYIPPNINLVQKAGYLYVRRKQLIGNTWDKCFLFTQAGNLMVQAKDEFDGLNSLKASRGREFAGSLLLDLNEDGVFAEPAEADDRRFVFQVNTAKHRRCVVLQTENERERDEWISTINNIVRDGGFVKGKPQDKKERTNSESSLQGQRSQGSTSGSVSPDSQSRNSVSPTQSVPSTTPTPNPTPSSSFSLDVPIQFDHMPPKEVNGTMKSPQAGPPKRINPFDQSAEDVLDALDQTIDSAAFMETFTVRFLGSMEVKQDRGEQVVHETIRQIMAARAIHNVFKMTESRMVVSNECMRLIDPSNNTVRIQFALEDVSYWSAHKENKRLFGFITRNRGEASGSFACHVFESNVPAEEICQGIGTATKIAFQALMAKKAEQKIRQIKDKETEEEGDPENLLLKNIDQLEDKDENDLVEEEDDLSKRLPLSPDGRYLVLTTPDEEDLLPEAEDLAISEPAPPPMQVQQSGPQQQPVEGEEEEKESEA